MGDLSPTSVVDPLRQQVQGLSALLLLLRQVRRAERVEELGFLMVNETRALLEYRQAVWWRPGIGVAAVSGLSEVDSNAPYVQWLNQVCRVWSRESGLREVSAQGLPPHLAEEWNDWLPAHGLVVPLPPAGTPESGHGLLLLARETTPQPGEITLMDELAEAYGHALRLFAPPAPRRLEKVFHRSRLFLLLGALALLLLPVRLTVLAPAEVVALEPVLVRAPLDGVISQVLVQPNQPVTAGQPLFNLDDATLRNKWETSKGALQVAEAEYRQVAQQSLFDEKSKVDLAIRKGQRDVKAAEVNYLGKLLSRVQVLAPRDGVAVFADVNDWLGKNVMIGEGVLTIADPQRVELDLHLPVADAIPLPQQAEVRLFLNVDPVSPKVATLTYASYRAEVTPDGVLAYRLKAAFQEGQPTPRLGLSGTAKVYGERVTLAYYLLRRPLAAARQYLGW